MSTCYTIIACPCTTQAAQPALTVFKSVDLFNENFSDGLFAFVDVVFADSLDDELLEVGELSGSLGADLGSHLLVVVLQLPNLLQISHVQIHLLLILTLKALSKLQ